MILEAFHQRVVAGTAATVSWQQIGGDGEPANPGTVTVGVTRADGTVLVASGTATSGSTTAARTYALTAAQTATLDNLTVTWTASGVALATTRIDVVAAPWFSNAELRARETSLESLTDYPAATIAAARLRIENQIERICHRRFRPGYSFRTIPASGRPTLVLPAVDVRTVRSAAIYHDLAQSASETLTAGELAAFPPSPAGLLHRYANVWQGCWVKVGFEWGLDAPPPDLAKAAMRLLRDDLQQPAATTPDQAATWNSTDFGWSAVFVTPGVRGAHTSIPWVNEVLDAYMFDEVGMA